MVPGGAERWDAFRFWDRKIRLICQIAWSGRGSLVDQKQSGYYQTKFDQSVEIRSCVGQNMGHKGNRGRESFCMKVIYRSVLLYQQVDHIVT